MFKRTVKIQIAKPSEEQLAIMHELNNQNEDSEGLSKRFLKSPLKPKNQRKQRFQTSLSP
jgi:oligoribonuclease (3'-5' exoribonuclease)